MKIAALVRPKRQRRVSIWRIGFAVSRRGIGVLREHWRIGEQTNVVAQRFGLAPGRVSQLRAWFRNHWEQFQAEAQPGGCAA